MLFKDKELHEGIERQAQGVVTIQEEIGRLHNELRAHIADTHEKHVNQNKQLAQIAQTQINNATQVATELERIKQAATHFERAISNFEHVKGKIDTILMQHMEELTQDHANKMTQKIAHYHTLSNEIGQLAQTLTQTKDELAKFNRISSEIKSEDFTLHKHARNLQLADKRKLELERENDQLKGILAKMKKRIKTNY